MDGSPAHRAANLNRAGAIAGRRQAPPQTAEPVPLAPADAVKGVSPHTRIRKDRMSSELDRQGLLDIFVMEAAEALTALSMAVNPPGDAVPSPQELQNQYVWAHKVRGASGIYGFSGLSLLGELLETTLEQSTAIDPSLWLKTVGVLRGMVEAFQSQLEIIKQGGNEDLTVSAH